MALYNDVQSFQSNNLIDDFRTATTPLADQLQSSDCWRFEKLPIFRGTFNLKQSKVALKIDSSEKTEEVVGTKSGLEEEIDANSSQNESMSSSRSQSNQALNEIIMFCNEFVIHYNHFDALNLNNPHQVSLNATCKDMGVYLFNQGAQRPKEGGAEPVDVSYKMKKSLINIDQQLEPEDNNISNSSEFSDVSKPMDVIYRMHENTEDIMKIEINFGNQNIKESQISNMESTEDFVDAELSFKFLPIVFIYRQEFVQLLNKFMEINQCISDNVKLRALEIQEQMMENLSLQNVFDNQIQSVQKIRVQLDSSKIILPINNRVYCRGHDCWIIDTGNMNITNEKNRSQPPSNSKKGAGRHQEENPKIWRCEEGYNPLNVDISHINMLYCSNVKDLTFQDEATYRHRVLRELNIKVLAMMRDQAHKSFKNPLKQPLMKLKVFADELNLVFTPVTYLHLVNISKCLQVQDSRSKESEQGLVQERFRLFENAKSLDMVKMKNSMNLMWKPYLAVISGSYIYFFNVEHKEQVKSIMKFIQRQNLKK